MTAGAPPPSVPPAPVPPGARPRRRILRFHRLGLVEYGDALQAMESFAKARRSGGLTEDVLLLAQHPPTITLGRAARPGDVLAPPALLAQKGAQRFTVAREGDVAVHVPGQLCVYPVIDLRPFGDDPSRLGRALEDVALASLTALGVQARRLEAAGGLYVGDDPPRLLGASGLGALRGVSQHGLWLNVDIEDLSPLAWVAPGGQQGLTATTVAREAQAQVSMPALEQSLAEGVARVLGAEWRERTFDRRTVSVCLLRERDGKIEALLLYRHPHRGGFWQPVTGTQERGETPLETARREIREESGLALEPIPLHYKHCFVFEGRRTRGVPRLFEETAFAARIEGDPTITLDRREHGEHRWAPLEEAIAAVPFLGLKKGLRLASKALF